MTTPELWRNNPLLVWLTYLAALLVLITGLIVCGAGIAIMVQPNISGLWVLVLGGIPLLKAAHFIFAIGRNTSRSEARFESNALQIVRAGVKPDVTRIEGVDSTPAKNQDPSVRIDWSNINAVFETGGVKNEVTIQMNSGPDVTFNAFQFFWPSHLGKAIARRAGKEYVQ